MASTVYANCCGVVHKGSGGMSIVFPDVCKTPTPGGPVPIPYPNIGTATDTSDGTKKVKIDGEMAMVKGAKYTKSSGDEPGSVGGVVSGCNKSAVEFMLYSFDIKFEGKNACRMGDMMFHNKKNIMG